MNAWYYFLVFAGSLLVDVVPFPLPPAFAVMVVLQIAFDLNIWAVIAVGVAGSVAGRYILSLYIPKLSGEIFKPSKNEDVQFLGKKMKEKAWESHVFILLYSLLPLPTTPLFIAGGMARMKPYQIFPAFVLGKLISDSAAVLMGKTVVETTAGVAGSLISWRSMTGLTLWLLLIGALLFFDWRTLLQRKRIRLKFKIWK